MDSRSLQTFLPRSRSLALASHSDIPESQAGVCLFADISGFTPLGEALRLSLGERQGAEELATTINQLFDQLAASVFRYGGDILNFSGDAITCWYPDAGSSPLSSLASALEMQRAVAEYGTVKTKDEMEHRLTVKIGLAYGSTRRMLVGDPQYGLFDFLTGQALTSMATAQHLAEKNQVIIDPELRLRVGDQASIEKEVQGCWLLKGLNASPASTGASELPLDIPIEVLRPFFPPAVFQFLAGTVDQFVAEMRNVAAGFVQFDGLDYINDPEVQLKLNHYLGIIQHLADDYGGNLIYLDYGDKGSVLMVAFGAPVAHEEDAAHAVGWAMALQSAVRELPFISSQKIGLARGPAYVGPLGARTRRSYTVMGDEVTAAARLMQACQSGQILLSQQMANTCGRRFVFHQFPGYQVKGKGEPIPVAMPVAEMPQLPQMAMGPLIGRDAEKAVLEQALQALLAGRGGVVRIHGLEGAGKSCLAADLASQAMRYGVRVLTGYSQSVGQRTPYLPWREILRGLLGIQPAWPALQQAFQIQSMLGWMLPEGAPLAPLLGDLLGIQIADTAATASLPVQERQAALFRLVGDLLERAASQQPQLLLIEDCHWADRLSCELIENISIRANTCRLLLVVVHRPGEDPAHPILPCLASTPQTIEISLENLPQEAVQVLATRLLGGEVGADLLLLIQERTEGNPLFIEEMAQIIRETHGVIKEKGQWVLVSDRAQNIRLPESIQGIVLARLDRLDEGSKLTLKVASVVGRSFELLTVQEVHPARISDEQFSSHLETLETRRLSQILVGQKPPAGRFLHGVIQEVTYDTLTVAQRQELHRSIAGWIEGQYHSELAPHYALLAHHFEKAGETAQAVQYLLKAGDQARLLYASQEARALYKQALGLLYPQVETEADQIARTLMRLGLACQDAFEFTQARQQYEEAFRFWQRAGGVSGQQQAKLVTRPLRLDFPYLPLTLDPALAEDLDSMVVVAQLFSGLVEQGPGLDLIPNAAESWEMADDGLSFVFHLNPELLWSDGEPIRAHDFVFAWLRVLDPATASPVAYMLFDLKGARSYHQGMLDDPSQVGVQALDDLTLQVQLERPVSYFLSLLAHTAFLPVPAHKVAEFGEAWAEPGKLVTNGYFTLQSWEQAGDQEGRLLLQASPFFQGCFTGNVRFVELHALPSGRQRVEAYLSATLDTLSLRDLGERRPRLRERYGSDYLSAPMLAVGYVGFNLHAPPFDNLLARRAFVMAVDRANYANVALQGFSYPATGGFLPPGMPGHTPDTGLPFDPAAARQALAQSGYPGGRGFPELELVYGVDEEGQAAYIVSQWREHLGVTVTARSLEWEELDRRMREDLPPLFTEIFAADYADPENFLGHASPQQRWLGWQDPAYLDWLAAARRAADQSQRLDLYRQADRRLVECAVLLPFKYLRSHWLLKPWVKAFPLSPLQRGLWKDVVLLG